MQAVGILRIHESCCCCLLGRQVECWDVEVQGSIVRMPRCRVIIIVRTVGFRDCGHRFVGLNVQYGGEAVVVLI